MNYSKITKHFKVLLTITILMISLCSSSLSKSTENEIQEIFHKASSKFCELYNASINDIQKSEVFNKFNETREVFGEATGWEIRNWRGHLVSISTPQGGKYVDVKITSSSQGFAIGYIQYADFFGSGGIMRGDSVYNQLSKLKKGDPVVFSAKLQKGTRGLSEVRITEQGSLCSPNYQLIFTSVAYDEIGKPKLSESDEFLKGFKSGYDDVKNSSDIILLFIFGGFIYFVYHRIQENKKSST